jgi:hypothetical protein
MKMQQHQAGTDDMKVARIRRAVKATGAELWDQRVAFVFADVKAKEPTVTREQCAAICTALYGPRPAA